MPPPRLSAAAALALALLFSFGCRAARLAPEAAHIDALGVISGRAVDPTPGEPIVVALLAADGHIVTYDLASDDGRYVFVASPGAYEIVAFADGDRNFERNAAEPGGRQAVTIASATPGQPPRDVGELSLAAAAEIPPLDLSAFGAASGQVERSRRLGEVVGLDDPRFAPEVAESGMWEPVRFASESGLRLFFLEPYDPARTPVVFVHGALGSPRDFSALVAALDRSRFQPWVLYYPSGLSLDLSALYFAESLEEARQRLGLERVHVVAHSMGGLVSRAALSYQLIRERAPLVVELVTISTPWAGASGQRGMELGVRTAPAVAPSWRDMLPASTFLARIIERPLPAGVRHTLLFSFGGRGSNMVAGPDDGTVALATMLPWEIVQQAQYVLGFDADHMEILGDQRVVEVVGRALDGEAPTPGVARR
jgi:pimeloyl-ACP methyl ester carboxylesterase